VTEIDIRFAMPDGGICRIVAPISSDDRMSDAA
jgi:hypothetical protein